MNDFTIICRCCLIKSEASKPLIPLFKERDGIIIPNILKNITTLLVSPITKRKHSYCDKLVLYLYFHQMEENDNLPQMICNACTDTIYKVNKLISTTIESDKKLRDFLAEQSFPLNLEITEYDATNPKLIHSIFLSDDVKEDSSCDEGEIGETKKM
jgi:hypothetical protein